MHLDTYAIMCGINVISVHAVVEANQSANLKRANTCDIIGGGSPNGCSLRSFFSCFVPLSYYCVS